MTIARRLSALEGSLNPTQLVLGWLAEAHAHGSFSAYGDALLDLEPEEMPLNRLCHAAANGARASIRSRQPELVGEAVRQALRETTFRFLLALRINVVAHELLEREQLRHALHAALLALAAAESEAMRASEWHAESVVSVMQSVVLAEQELDETAAARRLAEERYLHSASALFPDAARALDEQREAARQLREMGETLAEMDGVNIGHAEIRTSVDLRLADLVEVAKVETLEKLNEEARAAPLALAWLRAKRAAHAIAAESVSTL